MATPAAGAPFAPLSLEGLSQRLPRGVSRRMLSSLAAARGARAAGAVAAVLLVLLALHGVVHSGAGDGGSRDVQGSVPHVETAWEKVQKEDESWLHGLIAAEAAQSDAAAEAAEIAVKDDAALDNGGYIPAKTFGATFTPERALADKDVAPCTWRCRQEDGSVRACVRRNLGEAAKRERVHAAAVIAGISGDDVDIDTMSEAILAESRRNRTEARKAIEAAREAAHEKRHYAQAIRATKKAIVEQQEREEDMRKNCLWGCPKAPRRRPALTAKLRGHTA